MGIVGAEMGNPVRVHGAVIAGTGKVGDAQRRKGAAENGNGDAPRSAVAVPESAVTGVETEGGAQAAATEGAWVAETRHWQSMTPGIEGGEMRGIETPPTGWKGRGGTEAGTGIESEGSGGSETGTETAGGRRSLPSLHSVLEAQRPKQDHGTCDLFRKTLLH